MRKAKIFINGKLIGTCNDPESFIQDMREKRRSGEISHEMNITHYSETDEVYIFNDPGRARRPLIVVNEGKPALKEEHLSLIKEGELKWEQLLTEG
ncbi:MAG: DNA-directed RNA polymerase subunit B, partial [Methanobacterium sp.]|nr:DNA-directed RNA polymerase subunit B [Methanobacterium sp.]